MNKSETSRYRWFVTGDINGFFGLMFDNHIRRTSFTRV